MIEDDSCVRNVYMSAESNFNYRKPTEEGSGLLAEVQLSLPGQDLGVRTEYYGVTTSCGQMGSTLYYSFGYTPHNVPHK